MIKAAHCRIYWAQGLQVPPATQGHQKSAQSWRNRYIKSWCDSYWIRFIMLHLCLLLQLSDIWGSTRGSWFPSGFSSFWINMVGGWKTTGKKCNHWSIEVHQTLIHCWTNCTNSIKCGETCWSCSSHPECHLQVWKSTAIHESIHAISCLTGVEI